MNNFNLKKYLVENKLTKNSQLNEEKVYTATDKEMSLWFGEYELTPSVEFKVDIEDGVVTEVHEDIENSGINGYDENKFAKALKPFIDAGVDVEYTPWRASGGNDFEGEYKIDHRSLNNAIKAKKIKLIPFPESPEEYLIVEKP